MAYRMHSMFLLYGLIWLVVVSSIIVSLWRSMRAQEQIARHPEGIARALSQRQPG